MNHTSDNTPSPNVSIRRLLYVRCSTSLQSIDRQIVNKEMFDFVEVDYCSGSFSLDKRSSGARLLNYVKQAKGDSSYRLEIWVHSLERLGRNLTELTKFFNLCSDAGKFR